MSRSSARPTSAARITRPASPSTRPTSSTRTTSNRARSPGSPGRAPYVLDNYSDVNQYAVFSEAQFNATDRFAIVAALRYDDYDTTYVRVARPPSSSSRSTTSPGASGSYSISRTTPRYMRNTAPGSSAPDRGPSSTWRGTTAKRTWSRPSRSSLESSTRSKERACRSMSRCSTSRMNNLIIDNPNSGNPNDVVRGSRANVARRGSRLHLHGVERVPALWQCCRAQRGDEHRRNADLYARGHVQPRLCLDHW